MEILAVIPARGGSKGIPGKNIKDLNGKPLIYYSIMAGKNSKYVTRTVLSTEDEKIKNVASGFKCEVVDRPVELAQDETKTIPVLIDVLNQLAERENYKPDLVVLLQPTCPLRDENALDKVIECYLENKELGCDSAFEVKNIGITHSMWRKYSGSDKVEALYDYRNRPRRQDFDKHFDMYTETGATYVCETDVMRDVNDFIGKNPRVVVVDRKIDIDTVEDFELVEKILKDND